MSVDTKHKANTNTVVLEEEKYQIAPHPHQMFKPLKARSLVEEVLQKQLGSLEYDPVTTPALTSSLAVDIKNCLKNLNLPRYKYMVQVVIAENKGAGMRMGARCMWDPKTDYATEAVFMNDSIYCCASVFAIYIY